MIIIKTVKNQLNTELEPQKIISAQYISPLQIALIINPFFG